MYICAAILLLIAGYLLLIYADKQSGFYKSLGTFLSWFVMLIGFVGFLCGSYSFVKYGRYHGKHGYHHYKCEHYKHHSKEESEKK